MQPKINALKKIEYKFKKNWSGTPTDQQRVDMAQGILDAAIGEDDIVVDNQMPTSLFGTTLTWSAGAANDAIVHIGAGAIGEEHDLSDDPELIPFGSVSAADMVIAGATTYPAVNGDYTETAAQLSFGSKTYYNSSNDTYIVRAGLAGNTEGYDSWMIMSSTAYNGLSYGNNNGMFSGTGMVSLETNSGLFSELTGMAWNDEVYYIMGDGIEKMVKGSIQPEVTYYVASSIWGKAFADNIILTPALDTPSSQTYFGSIMM